MTAYDESFRWRGHPAELADSSDDSEGEQWAEFYALDDTAAAQALIDGFAADLTHLLLRQRLWQHYFQGGFLNDVDQLAGKHRVLASGEESGWRVKMSVIENAALPAQVVAPPSMATLHLPHLPDIHERMRDAHWSDWRALDLDWRKWPGVGEQVVWSHLKLPCLLGPRSGNEALCEVTSHFCDRLFHEHKVVVAL